MSILCLKFILWNYCGHVGGHAEVHQHGGAPHAFTLNIQNFSSPVTSSINALSLQKVLQSCFLIALYKPMSSLSFLAKELIFRNFKTSTYVYCTTWLQIINNKGRSFIMSRGKGGGALKKVVFHDQNWTPIILTCFLKYAGIGQSISGAPVNTKSTLRCPQNNSKIWTRVVQRIN